MFHSMTLAVSGVVVDLVSRRLLRLGVAGLDNVPSAGPAIIAINHISVLDPVVVGSQILRKRQFQSIGKKELFAMPVVGHYLRAIGSFPVDRDRSDLGALRAALDVLERGELLMIAPEGTRGKAGRPRTPKPGIAFLAHHSGAPVVPTRVFGTDLAPWPGRQWVHFGAPVRFAPEGRDGARTRDAYREFSESLMAGIYALERPGALSGPGPRCGAY